MVRHDRKASLFLVVGFILTFFLAIGQSSNKTTPKGNIKLLKRVDSLFRKSSVLIRESNFKGAESCLDQALKISTDQNYVNQRILCHFYYGNLFVELKDFNQAAMYFNTGLSLAVKNNQAENVILFNERLAFAFLNNKEFDRAYEYYENLVRIYTESGDNYALANTYSNLGSLYFAKKDMSTAQDYLAKSSSIFNKIKDIDIKKIARNVGDKINTEQGDETEEEVGESGQQINNQKSKAKSLSRLGNIYKEMGSFEQAKEHFQKSFKIYQAEQNFHEMAASSISLGDISLNKKDYQKAKKYYEYVLDLSLKNNIKISQMEAYKGLSFVLSYQKNYKDAYDAYQKYIAERDLIYADDRLTEINKVRVKMELEKQDIQLKLLLKENEVDKLELENNRIWLFSMGIILIISVFLMMLLYSRYRLKKRLNSMLESKNRDMQKVVTELRESEKQLIELNNTKDQFFSIISHDLKGPINSLKGYLSLVKTFPDNFTVNDLKDFAVKMDGSVKNLSQLLNNLLEWAMVQTGAIKLRLEKFDVDELVTRKIELFTPQIITKGISINFIKPPKIVAHADRNMIEFVVRNLLHNAIKFTNQDGKIEIKAAKVENSICISIADDGIGMDKKALDSLFNADRRYIQEGTNRERGSGLGLILCVDFIKRNNGTIEVQSTPSKGSTFTIKFPASN